MSKPMSEKEYEVLCKVMDALEFQFPKTGDAGAQAEYVDHDENLVYLDVWFEDGTSEQLKLTRELLTSGKSAKAIASLIW